MRRYTTCLLVCLGVLGAAARSAVGVMLVPVVPEGTGFAPGMAAHIDNTQVFDRGDVGVGPADPWELGDFRVAIDTASTTINAMADETQVRIDTFSSLRDEAPGNFTGPEATPDIRDLLFRVDPTTERRGDPVSLYLDLSWQASASSGGTPDSQAFATLTGVTNSFSSGQLFRREESQVVEVLVGEVYELSVFHQSVALNSVVTASSMLRAGVTPMDATAPTPQLAGDYNRDGTVDAADYTVWRDAIDAPYDFNVDGNGDGVIDAGDLQVLANWYGVAVPGLRTVAAPEPAAGLLALGVFVATTSRVRRR